jgi:hypothetical protein
MILTERNLKEADRKQIRREFGVNTYWRQNPDISTIENLVNVDGGYPQWSYVNLIHLPEGGLRFIHHPPLRKVH